ncbi:MAG TPA: hypothetical protein VHQ90_10980 [Thermoanaerobaculia bacterium]|nr:hypothetical protein [Thermoanaerobaculia bacterium]
MTPDRFVTTSRSRKHLYGAAVLALLILGSVAAIATAPRDLTWSVPSATPTVVAGNAPTTTTVSLTAVNTLPNAVVRVSPSLAGLVSVSPSDLSTLPKGRTVTLTLTSSAPASSTPGVVQGSIQIEKENPNHQPYGTPLPVNLHITWPAVTTQGVTLTYPPTWTLDQQSPSLGGPVEVRTFAQYAHGGVRPHGGATIDVTRTPLPQEPLATTIAADLSGATIDATSNQQVAGASATRVSYHDSYTPVSQESGVTVYVPVGVFLYKLSLEYDQGDPNEATLLATFNNLLNAVTLAAS